jgi:hypothetical protein
MTSLTVDVTYKWERLADLFCMKGNSCKCSLFAIFIAVFLVSLPPVTIRADPVTNDSLNGVWEAVLDCCQVYRMDIRAHGESYLCHAMGINEAPSFLYHLVKKDVRGGRVLSLRFQVMSEEQAEPPPAEIIVRLEALGVSTPNGFEPGGLKTTVIEGHRKPVSHSMIFRSGDWAESLAEMSKIAEKRIPPEH